MRLLKEPEREALMRYVNKDEAYNLFIIGDVENFGLEGEVADVAVQETNGYWDSVALRYERHFVVYSQRDEYDAEAVASHINARDYFGINGKGSVVEKLIPYFPDLKPRITILARCNSVSSLPQQWRHNALIRRIQPQEAVDVISLFCRIREFRDQYIGREADSTASLERNLNGGGIGIGAFIDGELVSYAQTTAQNSRSAMITGVCTLPAYERQGLATSVMTTLCQSAFDSGLAFLCLFYDNPLAGRIYERIGFQTVGEYLMLTPNYKSGPGNP